MHLRLMVEKSAKNGAAIGFDADADFIPLDLSDDINPGTGLGTSRPLQASPGASPFDANVGGPPASSSLNGQARKRKRSDGDTDPERGPSVQRRRIEDGGCGINAWQSSVDAYTYNETARILHQEVLDFSSWISPTKEEESVRALVVKRIVDAVEAAFPQTRVSPFGSYNTKLYTPDADIDMVVDWPGQTWTKSAMRRVAHTIERKGLGHKFAYIFGARVPIIKFVDTHACIDVDLSFNQTNALQVATLVHRYLREFPALRPLVMILKTLFQQKNLSTPAEGGLGSYSIICIVISFLQHHPKVAAGQILPEENLGAMLIEILELYGTRFNYDRVAIAVDEGGYYFDKLEMQSMNQKVWKQICIRDPNDFTNNIAKASHQVDNIIKVFTDAFREITTRCYMVHERIRAGVKVPWGTKSGSILDAIVQPLENNVRQKAAELVPRHATLKPSQNSLTSKQPNRRERRQKERLKKDADKKRGSGPKSVYDETKDRAGEQRPNVKRGDNSIVGGSKHAPIVLDDSSEATSPVLSSETPLASKKDKQTDKKKAGTRRSRRVVNI